MKTNIFDLDYQELESTLTDWGEPAYRTQQIWEGLFRNLWTDTDQFSSLPLSIREKLQDEYLLSSLRTSKSLKSEDGETTKFLYELNDGSAIETVLMSYEKRNTVCISSQVGCAMGCDFCATGNMGFSRNLSPGEIIEQVIRCEELLRLSDKKLTNIVLMGMGEPFHNYSAVMKAIGILMDNRGFSFGARRFTISTVGLVPGIRRFTKERTQINLAISLHAADDELRSSMMKINNKYPISELMDACFEYIDQTRRRISIEWALIDGINDTLDQAKKLEKLIQGRLFHVNLIRLNPTTHYSGAPTNTDRAAKFQKVLTDAGIPATFRVRRGIDIQAGCGQLASES
jgi:23S rRNA (adenine2503-C2)-methyltransferase